MNEQELRKALLRAAGMLSENEALTKRDSEIEFYFLAADCITARCGSPESLVLIAMVLAAYVNEMVKT